MNATVLSLQLNSAALFTRIEKLFDTRDDRTIHAEQVHAGLEERFKMPNEQRNSRWVVRIAGYIFVLLIPLIFIVGLETAGKIYLKSQDRETYPLLINRQSQESTYSDVLDTRIWMSTLDPQLSHSHGAEAFQGKTTIPGFVIYGAQTEDATLRIVALGGSTTDPLADGNWPEQLAEILNAKGVKAQVYNGGVAGYSSNQELLKLVRDVLPLKPDLVISLSGINDLGFLHSVKSHPMVHPYQYKIFKEMINRGEESTPLLPNTVAAGKMLSARTMPEEIGVGFGPVVSTSPAKQWMLNQRLMHAVAEECGIQYLGILQPTMGTEAQNLSVEEQGMLDVAAENYWRGNYLEIVREFYREAQAELPDEPFLYNLIDLFQDKQNMYRDARHQNYNGCKVLATAISEELDSRGMLAAAP